MWLNVNKKNYSIGEIKIRVKKWEGGEEIRTSEKSEKEWRKEEEWVEFLKQRERECEEWEWLNN